jgi:hypothetical protein
MTPDEIEACFSKEHARPVAIDHDIFELGLSKNVNGRTRKRALYLPETVAPGADDWRAIPLRHIWCDRSVWHIPWAAWSLHKEVEEAKMAGHRMRDITSVRLPGANHFVSLIPMLCPIRVLIWPKAHWDQPERLFHTVLAEDTDLAEA